MVRKVTVDLDMQISIIHDNLNQFKTENRQHIQYAILCMHAYYVFSSLKKSKSLYLHVGLCPHTGIRGGVYIHVDN